MEIKTSIKADQRERVIIVQSRLDVPGNNTLFVENRFSEFEEHFILERDVYRLQVIVKGVRDTQFLDYILRTQKNELSRLLLDNSKTSLTFN